MWNIRFWSYFGPLNPVWEIPTKVERTFTILRAITTNYQKMLHHFNYCLNIDIVWFVKVPYWIQKR